MDRDKVPQCPETGTKFTRGGSTVPDRKSLRPVHENLSKSEHVVSAVAGWHAHLEQLECHLSRQMGFMQHLLRTWEAADPDTPLGKFVCIRTHGKFLDGKFIRLEANWDIGSGKKTYQEIAHYGFNRDKIRAFWSFTSDGGMSIGTLADVEAMHTDAKGFVAQMPSGLTRFGFWPTAEGMVWAAEAKNKKGRLSMIHYECRRIGQKKVRTKPSPHRTLCRFSTVSVSSENDRFHRRRRIRSPSDSARCTREKSPNTSGLNVWLTFVISNLLDF